LRKIRVKNAFYNFSNTRTSEVFKNKRARNFNNGELIQMQEKAMGGGFERARWKL